MPDDISISVPFRKFQSLLDLIEDYPKVIERLKELENEVDALRSIQSHMMIQLGDVRRGK